MGQCFSAQSQILPSQQDLPLQQDVPLQQNPLPQAIFRLPNSSITGNHTVLFVQNEMPQMANRTVIYSSSLVQ
jgi:hypothetical protein